MNHSTEENKNNQTTNQPETSKLIYNNALSGFRFSQYPQQPSTNIDTCNVSYFHSNMINHLSSQENNSSIRPATYSQKYFKSTTHSSNKSMMRSPLSIKVAAYQNNMTVENAQQATNLVISTRARELIYSEQKDITLNSRLIRYAPSSPYSPLSPMSPTPEYVAWRSSLFKPKFPARALLNVYISPVLTTNCLNLFHEKFPDAETLYYYLDISTALQINDKQMYTFKYDESGIQNNTNANPKQIIFANYDLHHCVTGVLLYGCIVENHEHEIKEDKWMWKLVSFMDASQIYHKYGIPISQLPNSSRRQITFTEVLKTEYYLTNIIYKYSIVETTSWKDIKQIKSAKRVNRKKKNLIQMPIKITPSQWIQECKQSWYDYPELIPIVINENQSNNNLHWIEWIKLIGIRFKSSNNKSYVGISFRYLKDMKQWIITSICLDKGDIQNKHRLVGLRKEEKEKYLGYLKYFTITGIQWI